MVSRATSDADGGRAGAGDGERTDLVSSSSSVGGELRLLSDTSEKADSVVGMIRCQLRCCRILLGDVGRRKIELTDL